MSAAMIRNQHCNEAVIIHWCSHLAKYYQTPPKLVFGRIIHEKYHHIQQTKRNSAIMVAVPYTKTYPNVVVFTNNAKKEPKEPFFVPSNNIYLKETNGHVKSGQTIHIRMQLRSRFRCTPPNLYVNLLHDQSVIFTEPQFLMHAIFV